MLADGGLVRLLGGEADPAHAVAEQPPQLVLGRDDGDAGARLGEGGQDGVAAEILRVVHHHFGARLAVPEVVAADAVHGGRHAGDDGEVVRICEARHHAGPEEPCALRRGRGQKRHGAGPERLLDVVGLTAVHADDHERARRPRVGSPVDGDGLARRGGHDSALASGLRPSARTSTPPARPQCLKIGSGSGRGRGARRRRGAARNRAYTPTR